MKKKRIVIMSTLLITILVLGIVTYAYFRRNVAGGLNAFGGNLVLIVNEADAAQSGEFEVILKRSDAEPFIMPYDNGTFDINIDTTGSSASVDVTITISRENLPNNLKFYFDSRYTEEVTTKSYVIKKSDDMTMTVPVYWYWDGSKDDENDNEFMDQEIVANVSVSATIAKNAYEILLNSGTILDTNVDFKLESSETNGKGLMMRDGTQNDRYPIVYYRGDVANNNVIFADYCWLIVRTTETGGIKLLYNGEVNSDGSCNNYSNVTATKLYNEDYMGTYIDRTSSIFNPSDASPVYVGYMYNDINTYFENNTLDKDGYKSHLDDKGVDSETGRHVQNLKDSTIKGIIDAWYAANILGKPEESLLEDTVWCVDRSITSESSSLDDYGSSNQYMDFGTITSLQIAELLDESIVPNLSCTRDVDKFTVNSNNGNGDLTYPIGMLTSVEVVLAGIWKNNTANNYLVLPSNNYWGITPAGFYHSYAYVSRFYSENNSSSDVCSEAGVRPSISLNENAYITGGNGSFETPYIVLS